MDAHHAPLARTRTLVLAVVALVAVGYAALGLLYAPGGEIDVAAEPPSAADVTLRMDLVSVTPGDYEALLRFRLLDIDDALLAPDGRLLSPLRISVSASDGTDDIVVPASAALAPAEDSIGISGGESAYPFDTHAAAVTVRAASLETDPGTGVLVARPLAVDALLTGGAAGWDVDAGIVPADDGGSSVNLRFERSATTKLFALLLVGMALVLSLFAITVGITTASGRQPVDSSILGWGASLVFALLAVRFYLPGQPPIGSGIDIFAYVWITLLAFIGLALTTAMWLRRRWDVSSGAAQAALASASTEDVVDTDRTGEGSYARGGST